MTISIINVKLAVIICRRKNAALQYEQKVFIRLGLDSMHGSCCKLSKVVLYVRDFLVTCLSCICGLGLNFNGI